MSRFKFFDDGSKTTNALQSPHEAVIEQPIEVSEIQSKKYRYRIEQVIFTKFNGQIISQGSTKQEYIVQKNTIGGIVNTLDIELIENVIQFDPPQLQTAISLLCDADIVKCDVSIRPNPQSGKMNKIEDKSRILIRWENYKRDLTKKFDFLKSNEEWNNINTFVALVEDQIQKDDLLLADYESKIFFDLIFDKYLISIGDFKPFTKYYLSNLFDHRLLLLNIVEKSVQESPETIQIEQVGTLDKKDINENDLIDIYNDKFKPYIGFSYTTYDYKFSNNYTLNTLENVIQQANVVIIEEVKNNVQITINYELKLVDL